MISVEHVYKSFREKKVLEDICINIRDGEFVVVLGSSGAGKSTLLRCMNGLYIPDKGSVEVSGTKLSKKNMRDIRKKVGFIFQGSCVIGNLSVLTNVLAGCLGRRRSVSIGFPAAEKKRAMELIDMVGLADMAYTRTDKLSGGQRQRVGIARALLQEPQILLADEPVASLDPVTGREILELLKKINREMDTTIICNLHQVEYAKEYAQRIIGIRNGRIDFDEEVEAVTEYQIKQIYEV